MEGSSADESMVVVHHRVIGIWVFEKCVFTPQMKTFYIFGLSASIFIKVGPYVVLHGVTSQTQGE